MCIARKNTVKLEKKCECDDIMWIDWKGVKAAGVYLVQPHPLQSETSKE